MAQRSAPIFGLLLILGACADTDFDRPHTWQAEGVNERNLRAMVADPAHLTRGAAAATDRGQQGAAAVSALEDGRRPALPRGLSDIAPASGPAGVSQGGGGGN